MARELTIKAKGINYNVRLVTDRLRKRGLKEGNINPLLTLCGILEREKRSGRVEGDITGTFTSVSEEQRGEECGYEVYWLTLRGKREKDYVHFDLTQWDNGAVGVIKTKSHWYEKWKERRLENIRLIWEPK